MEAARREAVVIGVDISEAMLNVARRRAADASVAVDLYFGDVQALSFDDDTFDVVFATTVLCFVDAPDSTIRALLNSCAS